MGPATAPLVGRLQDHRRLGHDAGRGVPGDLLRFRQRGQQVIQSGRLLQGIGGLAQLLVSILLEPFGPLGRLGDQQGFQVDRSRGPVRLRRLDGDGPALGHTEVEVHHRLVDAADLFDIQATIAEPLAVEDQQVLEHAVNHAIRDMRDLGLVVQPPGRFPRPAFEEVVAVRVEQVSLAGRNPQAAMTAAIIDHAEQRQQLRPGPVALVHRVGVPAGVGPQPLEQPGDRVEVGVDRIARQEVAVLGEKQEHQPHEHRQEPSVYVVGVFAEHVGEKLALAVVVGRLESADQLIEGGQDLLGELRGDDVLVFAAVGQDGGAAAAWPAD